MWSCAACMPSVKRTAAFVLGFAVLASPLPAWAGSADQPPYDGTADTVFDIITKSDPSTFSCMEYAGRGDRQIWDKRVDGEPVVNAFLFVARYSDGTNIEIANTGTPGVDSGSSRSSRPDRAGVRA